VDGCAEHESAYGKIESNGRHETLETCGWRHLDRSLVLEFQLAGRVSDGVAELEKQFVAEGNSITECESE